MVRRRREGSSNGLSGFRCTSRLDYFSNNVEEWRRQVGIEKTNNRRRPALLKPLAKGIRMSDLHLYFHKTIRRLSRDVDLGIGGHGRVLVLSSNSCQHKSNSATND